MSTKTQSWIDLFVINCIRNSWNNHFSDVNSKDTYTRSDPLFRSLGSIQESDVALFGLLDIPHTTCMTQDMIRTTRD